MPEVTVAGLRHLLATVALGPLLLLQGRHVRDVTPRLPEPRDHALGERAEVPHCAYW